MRVHVGWRCRHAPLPVGWTEVDDGEGEVFYHNPHLNLSSYKHPLDDAFREQVASLRVQLEEELAAQEEREYEEFLEKSSAAVALQVSCPLLRVPRPLPCEPLLRL